MNNKESFKNYPEVPSLKLPVAQNNINTEKNDKADIKIPESSYHKNNTILNMLNELNNKK